MRKQPMENKQNSRCDFYEENVKCINYFRTFCYLVLTRIFTNASRPPLTTPSYELFHLTERSDYPIHI